MGTCLWWWLSSTSTMVVARQMCTNEKGKGERRQGEKGEALWQHIIGKGKGGASG